MKATPQTIQQIERAIRKVADKFPSTADPVMTDIHLQVKPDSGELLAFDDDMEELTRVVVEQWLQPNENLYEAVTPTLKQVIAHMRSEIDRMSVLHPFSFVLIDEERETLCDLYLVDEDTLLLDTELLKGLDKELDDFLQHLLEE